MKKLIIALIIVVLAAVLILVGSAVFTDNNSVRPSSDVEETVTASWVLDSVSGAAWQCDRASMYMALENPDQYMVYISWGSSASETTEWAYTCRYDAATRSLQAVRAVCDNLVCDDNGNMTRTNVFNKNSNAVFSLNAEGSIVIRDAGDNALEGKVFERIPSSGNE